MTLDTTQQNVNRTIVSEFVNAVKRVINVAVGDEILEFSTLPIKSDQLPGEVSATIELTGDLRGQVAVSLPIQYAQTIAMNILGCSDNEIAEDEVREGVGEIINQITGKVRTDLWNYGYRFNISTPTIVNKSISQIEPNAVFPHYVIVFRSKQAEFSLQVNLYEANLI